MALWYLSFVKDGQFVGGTIVEAPSAVAAVLETHRLGINPKGEVRVAALDEQVRHEPQFAAYFERFVPREEVLAEPHEKL